MSDCKAKGFEQQNGTVRWSVKQQRVKLLNATPEILVTFCKLHHSTTNPTLFIHILRSVFPLVAFFILCAIDLSLFFNTFWHQACLLSSRVSLSLGVSPFLNLCHIHYHSYLGIKMLQWGLIHVDDYKDVTLWWLTLIAFMRKHKRIQKGFKAYFSQPSCIWKFETLLTNYKLLMLLTSFSKH